MRWIDASPRRATPEGHYPSIICTAPHQRDLLHRSSSAFVAHLNKPAHDAPSRRTRWRTVHSRPCCCSVHPASCRAASTRRATAGPSVISPRASSRQAPPHAPRGDLLMRQALEQARTAPAPIDRTARICAVGGEHVQLHPGGLRLDPGSCATSTRRCPGKADTTSPWHSAPSPPTSRTGVSARANVSDGPIDSPRGIGDIELVTLRLDHAK